MNDTEQTCTRCGAGVLADSRFCEACGARVAASAKATDTITVTMAQATPPTAAATICCPTCNSEWPTGTRFCGGCGLALSALPPPPAPAAVGKPIAYAYPPGATVPAVGGGPGSLRPRTVLAIFGGIGIIVGAVVDWSRGGNTNSFKLPAAFFFDWKATSQNPKAGYFLVALGVVCLAVSFVRGNGPVLVLCGLAALTAAVLYMAQLNSVAHLGGGDVSFTTFVGPGAWILGISGVVLVISPMITPRRQPTAPPAF
jgi:hypothetical protein